MGTSDTRLLVQSLGVLLYLMCFGRFPFEATPQATVDVLIQRGRYPMPASPHSPQTRTLVTTMLRAAPHDRPDIQQVLAVVGATLRPPPVAAMPHVGMPAPMQMPPMHTAPPMQPRAMAPRHSSGGWRQPPAQHVADSVASAASGHATDPFACSTGASHGSADVPAGAAAAFNPYGDPFAPPQPQAQQQKPPPPPKQRQRQQQRAAAPSGATAASRAGHGGARGATAQASAGSNSVASAASNTLADGPRRRGREQPVDALSSRQASARSAGVPAVQAPLGDSVLRPESKVNPFDDGSSAPSTRSGSLAPEGADGGPAAIVAAQPRLSAQVHDAATAEEYADADTSSSAAASPRSPRRSLGSSSDGAAPAAGAGALDNPFITRPASPADLAAPPAMAVSHPYVEDALRNTEGADPLGGAPGVGADGADAPSSSAESASPHAPPPSAAPQGGRRALGASDKRSSFSASGLLAGPGAPDARPIAPSAAPLAPVAEPKATRAARKGAAAAGQPRSLREALAALSAMTAQRDELQRRLDEALRECEARGARVAEMRSVIEALSNGHNALSAVGAPTDCAELASVERALNGGGGEGKGTARAAKKGGFFGVPNSVAGERAADAARGVERAEDYVKGTLSGAAAEGPPLAIGELRRCNSDIAFDWERAEANAAAHVAAAPEPLPQM